MDAYSDTAEVANDPIEQALPDAPIDNNSFEASLEKAFAKLDSVGAPKGAEPKATKETSPEPAAQTSEDKATLDSAQFDPIEELSDDIGDDWTPKAANRFKQLKEELKMSKSQLQELEQAKLQYETKIQELSGIAENKDIEVLQQKLEEYEKQQMFSDLEKTSVYQSVVAAPLKELLTQADQIADKYDVDANDLIDILSMTDADAQEEKLAELMPRASDRDKAKIYNIMEKIEPIMQRRAEMIQNTDQALAEAKLAEEQHQRAEAAERARMRTHVTRNVVERIQQKLPFLKGIDGLDFSSLEKEASSLDPLTIHAVDHAYNAVASKLLPTLAREYIATRREMEALTDQLAAYENAEPKMSGGSNNSSKSAAPSGSFVDRVNSALSSSV